MAGHPDRRQIGRIRNINTRTLINCPFCASMVRNPDDWIAPGRKNVLHHGPSKTTFRILVDLDRAFDETLALQDFQAELIGFWAGTQFPTNAELDLLRAEAVLVSLSYMGLIPHEGDDFSEAHTAGPSWADRMSIAD